MMTVHQCVECIDFIFRIEIVDTSEISTQPNCSLFIFDDAPDGGVGKSVRFVRVGSVKLEFTCALFIAI